jgi:hypothetical protein
MRSVVSDETVGLLLFDEPSASLDPTAEHGACVFLCVREAKIWREARGRFLNTHIVFVLSQICSSGFDSCEGTRRWCFRPTGLEI